MIGVFAAIYHPVGLAIVVEKWKNTGMRIAVNGVWGNLGVASAALLTGYFIDHGGWRMAFVVPGIVSILIGIAYTVLLWPEIMRPRPPRAAKAAAQRSLPADVKALLLRVSVIVFLTTAVSSIVFQSTTFALPKVFDERLSGIAVVGHRAGAARVPGVRAGLDRPADRRPFPRQAGAAHRVHHGGGAFRWCSSRSCRGWSTGPALLCAMAFMLAAFGQIPINDYMIGRLAEGEWRARIYGVRYVVSFTVLAAALPLIAFVYENWGFDALFRVLAVSAAIILGAVLLLPQRAAGTGGCAAHGRRAREPETLTRRQSAASRRQQFGCEIAIASAAEARLPLRVKPEPPRGPRSWSPSPAQWKRMADDSRMASTSARVPKGSRSP